MAKVGRVAIFAWKGGAQSVIRIGRMFGSPLSFNTQFRIGIRVSVVMKSY